MSNAAIAAVEIAVFEAKRDVLCDAMDAKRMHGIDPIGELQRYKDLQYEGPTLVAEVWLNGRKTRPNSDDGSCSGFYDAGAYARAWLELQSLESAKLQLTPAFVVATWLSGVTYEGYSPIEDFMHDYFDSATHLDHIFLLDNLGNVVAEGKLQPQIWSEDQHRFLDVPSVIWLPVDKSMAEDRDTMNAKADALLHEASMEAGYDNHHTADLLRRDAARIRRTIEIAENVDRLAA